MPFIKEANNDLLRLLADTLPGLVSYIDRDFCYRFLNARYRDWFGIEPKDFIGKTPAAIIGADRFAEAEPYLERVLAGETISYDSRSVANDRDLRSQVVPHVDYSGDVIGMIVMTTDVTEEKKERAVIERARDGAVSDARDKSRFLAAASHDLRQPLHALTLFARALSRRVETAETKELVAHMEAALSSLRDMFNALLDMSRLDAGLMKPHVEAVPVRNLFENLEAGFAISAEENGLRFRVRPLDVAIQTDHALFETMLRNLIANALKFTRTGGLLIGCRRRGERLRIEIYDTGSGIPDDRLTAIFDEFQRAKEKAKGENEGLGLGLAIVRRLADLLGMTLDVRSEVGRGSRFALEMPVITRPISRPATTSLDLDDGPSSLAGFRILVLDDDPVVQEALAQELADHGASVTTASNRDDLMALTSELADLDAAVIDYELAGDTGPGALGALNQRLGKEIPAIVLTGATAPATVASLKNSGCRWMTKPIDPDVLVGALRLIQTSNTI